MKKRRSNSKAVRPKEQALSASRRRWFGVIASFLAPLLAFALLEGSLRLAGYGYDTAFFKPIRINGREFLVNNDNFALQFFPPQLIRLPGVVRMEAQKPPHTCRIFILGESAALGDPSPAYGAGRYLQALLTDQFPGEKFEVINVSITAINSHAILPIARECARHQGDYWIVYMGNNEMVGPFGAASVFGAQAPPVWAVRFSLALQETRVGQALMAAVRWLNFKSGKNASWGGMEMFLGHQLPPDDPRREQVYANFKRNLHDILQAGLDSGAQVILNTVAVNLKDCSPFASIPLTNLPAAERLAGEGQQAWQKGRFAEAAQDFGQATQLQPLSADLQYNWAECLSKAPGSNGAPEHFQKACDYDTLPFRADSRINGLIRAAATASATPNLTLLDTAASETGGNDIFFEHVHFNFDGNYRLGRAWAEKIGAGKKAAKPWLAQGVCEQRLALTDWNRIVTLSEVARRRQQPPLNSQYDNPQELNKLQSELQTLHRHTDAAAVPGARAVYLEAIQREPDDYWLRFDFGDFLEAIGDWKGAADLWKQVEQILPQYYLGYLEEGRMLERTGQLDDAASAFQRTVELYPRMTVAWFELSNIHTSTGKYGVALKECERASQLEPQQAVFYVCRGRIFLRMNRAADAVEQFRRAIKIQPQYKEGHLALAQELSHEGRADEAKREFQAVLRLDPNNQAARQAPP
ncbi:MAG TPA: tetratricopeptide repeat protein [Candidatus Saccharimonadales bacterium]|nr:tetratricopeptide repeat protein [Candidatus Saccharimonadales bacterium]